MQMRVKCARFLLQLLLPLSTHRLPLTVSECVLCLCVCCVCVCVLACSHTFAALCGICYNFKCYTQSKSEAKLAPIVATSVWPDILARARSTWRVCEPANTDRPDCPTGWLPACLSPHLPAYLPTFLPAPLLPSLQVCRRRRLQVKSLAKRAKKTWPKIGRWPDSTCSCPAS